MDFSITMSTKQKKKPLINDVKWEWCHRWKQNICIYAFCCVLSLCANEFHNVSHIDSINHYNRVSVKILNHKYVNFKM